jgi:hypothetical protein
MSEGLAKQAKTLTDRQIKRVLAEVATHRYPERDRVIVLPLHLGRHLIPPIRCASNALQWPADSLTSLEHG